MKRIKFYFGLMLWVCNPTFAELEVLKSLPIVAPAGGIPQQDYKRLAKVFPTLASRPFKPLVYWHSDSDRGRALEVLQALKSDESWIWSLRGGYGCARIIPFLEKARRKGWDDSKKIWIGYSDCTCLHLWTFLNGGKTLHASMPKDWLDPSVKRENFARLNRILQNPEGQLTYSGLTPLNDRARDVSSIRGTVIGGNLTLLTNSIGTPWQLKARGNIIIIEDVDMVGYQIDRALYHLTQSNVLEGATAIIFGTFSGNNTNWRRALERFATETKIPVFYWPYFGHGAYNYPIPLGFKSVITAEKDDFVWVIPYRFL